LMTGMFGCASHGTNNVSELMAVMLSLMWLSDGQDVGEKQPGARVVVITDSEYVANGLNQGDSAWAVNTGANRCMWMAMLAPGRKGLAVSAKHLGRQKMNQICHDLANYMRVKAEAVMPLLNTDQKFKPANILRVY